MEDWWKTVGERVKLHLELDSKFWCGPLTMHYIEYLEEKNKKLQFITVQAFCQEFVYDENIVKLVFRFYFN